MLSVPYCIHDYKLDRMRELLTRLGNPQERLPIIHVGGTKGKGSTSAMISGILMAAGLNTGLFTSPHLDRVEERLAINGAPCPTPRLAELVVDLRGVVDAMDAEAARSGDAIGPTYFELTTALALMHFATAGVDAAVLEVGMGGRLDSTNVCDSQLSVITSISLDHTQQLGDTEEKIAREKAGIIKPGVPVVSGVCHEGARSVIHEVAAERGSPVLQLGADFDFDYHAAIALDSPGLRPGAASAVSGQLVSNQPKMDSPGLFPGIAPKVGAPSSIDFHSGEIRLNGLTLAMLGRHQGANAAVAIAAIQQLQRLGWPVPEDAIRRGLAAALCRARVELIGRQPSVVVDAAHNVASIAALLAVLKESFGAKQRRLVFATSRDKDARGMLRLLLPAFDEVTLTRYQENPRGMPAEELDALARELGSGHHRVASDPATAWASATADAGADDLIVATGSFFIAAEVRRLVVETPS
ncbi:MAG: bifunctional folylpolyglutamate synthase/dihydrofolate synthase [Planctomycetes bacterium]|nr:bifunctional folylpolyglutamate synthase/dihydrofolate synthase [Planctomycetota bacterium]